MRLDLEAIESAVLLRPQPGDIVIVRHPGRISSEAVRHISKALLGVLPPGCRIVILEDGMDIKLLRPEKAEKYVVEGGMEKHEPGQT